MKIICKDYVTLYNEVTSVSVTLDESEARKLLELDEIELYVHHVQIMLWVGIYSIVYSSYGSNFTSSIPLHVYIICHKLQ